VVVAATQVPAPLLADETFVAETLKQYPRLRSTRLYDMLVERGYEGSVRSVRRYVQRVRPEPKTEVFLRTEPLIAEQAQIDWGYVGKILIDGCTRQLWVFVIVLAYSRAMWAELVIDLTASSLRRSLVRACLYFCGVTRQWLFDNPKIVVLERHGDAVRFHPELLTLSGQLCVALRLCGVRKPQQKGKVERAIRYLRERFFAAHDSRSRPGQRRAPRLLRHDRQRASPSTLAPAARRRGASRGAEPPARAARPAP
jgi:transposase